MDGYNGDAISDTEWFFAEMEDRDDEIFDNNICPVCGGDSVVNGQCQKCFTEL